MKNELKNKQKTQIKSKSRIKLIHAHSKLMEQATFQRKKKKKQNTQEINGKKKKNAKSRKIKEHDKTK